MMQALNDDWIEIGKRCSANRRSLWVKFKFANTDSNFVHDSNVLAIELRAGREGDDAYIRITPDNPQFSELLDLFLVAQFAATT